MAVPNQTIFGGIITLTGTPIAVASILTAQERTDRRSRVQSVQLQAHPSNTALFYVGGKADFTGGGANCVAAVPKPTAATTGPFPSQSFGFPGQGNAPVNLEELYVNGTSNDIVIVGIQVQ